MSQAIHHLDEVHVISDLHLGGEKGFQVFDLAAPLKRLIDHLASRSKDRRLALVINGDMVDFLAEPQATYFDPHRAAAKLERIALEEKAFAPVFRALRDFVRTPNRQLVITLGNHDLELSLPWVREKLLEILSGGRRSARGRIHLLFEGSGYLCQVGQRRVLCVHGNEVDPWNLTDYARLREIGRELTQDRSAEPWTPNAGTKLVIDVMNQIKREYAFVDLLKPELEAAVPAILAVAPEQAGKVKRVLAVAGRLAWDAARRATGLLGDDDPAEQPSVDLDAELSRVLHGTLGPYGRGAGRGEAKELLDLAESRLRDGVDPLTLIPGDKNNQYLGLFGVDWKSFFSASRERLLFSALKPLCSAPDFKLDHQDDVFLRLDEEVGPGIDFVVAGHTHLERVLPRRRAAGKYFNSGTWIRLIRPKPQYFDSLESFSEVFETLCAGEMETLDAHQGLVERKPAVVSIEERQGKVEGRLLRVAIDGGELLTEVTDDEENRGES